MTIRKESKQGMARTFIAVMIDVDADIDGIPGEVEYEGVLIKRSECPSSKTMVDGATTTEVYPPWAHTCGKCDAGWWCEIGTDGKQVLRCFAGVESRIVEPDAVCSLKPDCWLPHFIHGC
ncbi:MAG: hypothetical protein PHR90_09880 [Sphaerochaetaceae bacterium]|nr:hypothetical protein [Sphaerochaetaceae bacterium]